MSDINVIVLTTSLDADSRSRVVARYAERLLIEHGAEVQLADVRDFNLPFCGADGCYENEGSKRLGKLISQSTHVVFASPVYNYDLNAMAKNVVELVGNAFEGKVVGFICAAGGHRSYMSVMPFANSLMLDFHCWIVPRFVFVTEDDVVGEQIVNEEVARRVRGLVGEMVGRTEKSS